MGEAQGFHHMACYPPNTINMYKRTHTQSKLVYFCSFHLYELNGRGNEKRTWKLMVLLYLKRWDFRTFPHCILAPHAPALDEVIQNGVLNSIYTLSSFTYSKIYQPNNSNSNWNASVCSMNAYNILPNKRIRWLEWCEKIAIFIDSEYGRFEENKQNRSISSRTRRSIVHGIRTVRRMSLAAVDVFLAKAAFRYESVCDSI